MKTKSKMNATPKKQPNGKNQEKNEPTQRGKRTAQRKWNENKLRKHSKKKNQKWRREIATNTNSVLVPVVFWPRFRHSIFSWSLVRVAKYALRSSCCCSFGVNVDPFAVAATMPLADVAICFKWLLVICSGFGFSTCVPVDELPWRVRRLLVGMAQGQMTICGEDAWDRKWLGR